MLRHTPDSDAGIGSPANAEEAVLPSARILREGPINSRWASPSLRRAKSGWRVGRLLMFLVALHCVPAIAQQVDDQHADRMAEGLRLFRQEVRPLLVETCLACHGGGQVLGGLDLSSHGSLVASGKIGESSESSALIAVLRHEREPFMPFGQERLADATITAVARWVDLGAPYDRPLVDRRDDAALSEAQASRTFWSFRPLAAPSPPDVDDEEYLRTPIDRFVLARLEAAGIKPNQSADRRTLVRRAWLSLLGLPPSPKQVEAFIGDSSPGAYERMIDDLLESPHYGERWARHWMDIARFAESDGFEEDFDRPYAYHYRDFLIKALNRDMPYDRFVRLQIAGDELEPENPLALMATGFLGAGAFPTQITEAEFETVRYDELDDMIGTLGTAMLGLTVGCARCHDHKHDPISAHDYYSMAAVFGRTTQTEIEYDPSPGDYRREKANWLEKHSKLVEERRAIEEAKLDESFQHWLEEGARDTPTGPWQVLEITGIDTTSDAVTDALEDGSILFSGDNVHFEDYTFGATLATAGIRALRVEALTHPSLPFNGPGRSHDGQFLLGVLTVEAHPLGQEPQEPVKLKIANAIATDQVDDNTSSITASVRTGSTKAGWTIRPDAIGSSQAAILEFAEPLGFDAGTRLIVKMRFGYNPHFSLGRVRLSVSTQAEVGFAIGEGAPQALAEGLAVLREEGAGALSAGQKAALLRNYASKDPEWVAADKAIRDHELRVPISTVTRIQATAEGFKPSWHNAEDKGYPHFYEQTFVLRRGDPSQKGSPAQPGFLPVLTGASANPGRWSVRPPPGWDRSGLHRTSLARWIADPEQGAGGLLARVIVNRLWHHHFGTGIVATPSNFGTMGARPTHPQLLDWLAADLISNGWRLKRLHRVIMTSSVYMASSSSDDTKAAADSSNRLRWRWSPRRLEAEAIRDSLLSVSGMLDPSMYGPGMLNEESGRRGVYFFVKRSELVPSMMLFDWPEHLVGIGNRPSTTIAPQALQFLNSPQARRYAEGFARRLVGLNKGAAIEKAYLVAFSRPPMPPETEAGLAFLDHQRNLYVADGMPDPDRLSLVDYCQSLLGLNEFLYIR